MVPEGSATALRAWPVRPRSGGVRFVVDARTSIVMPSQNGGMGKIERNLFVRSRHNPIDCSGLTLTNRVE